MKNRNRMAIQDKEVKIQKQTKYFKKKPEVLRNLSTRKNEIKQYVCKIINTY
jgi:hypothetical protein